MDGQPLTLVQKKTISGESFSPVRLSIREEKRARIRPLHKISIPLLRGRGKKKKGQNRHVREADRALCPIAGYPVESAKPIATSKKWGKASRCSFLKVLGLAARLPCRKICDKSWRISFEILVFREKGGG